MLLVSLYMEDIRYLIFFSNEDEQSYNIHIKKSDEILPWKKFNKNMAVSIEYDLEY